MSNDAHLLEFSCWLSVMAEARIVGCVKIKIQVHIGFWKPTAERPGSVCQPVE